MELRNQDLANKNHQAQDAPDRENVEAAKEEQHARKTSKIDPAKMEELAKKAADIFNMREMAAKKEEKLIEYKLRL